MQGMRPEWLTFDCYGTLVQFDKGLMTAVKEILERRGSAPVDPSVLIEAYDRYEHALEQSPPFRAFRSVAAQALQEAMKELGLPYESADAEILVAAIPKMPPFPEAVPALRELKDKDFKLCIISNTDDDIIAGNVAQLDGLIDEVVTAQQAQAYKPSPKIFQYAHRVLDVGCDEIVHICASPHLDLAAARDMRFRSIWIDRKTGREPLPDYVPDQVFATLEPVPSYFKSLGGKST